MIPSPSIEVWRTVAPWQQSEQVEQDLLLSRILVEMFQDEALSSNLLFRGGTALSKLYLPQPLRYSEDLDFVQVRREGVKPLIQGIQKLLTPWLGSSQVKIAHHSTRITFHFLPENQPDTKRRIKIEINTREHFSLYPVAQVPFKVNSDWFKGECLVPTYQLDELAATKLKALYQRRKGRDLFDMYKLLELDLINPERVFKALQVYLDNYGQKITAKQFRDNIQHKLTNSQFLQDTQPLLLPDIAYDPNEAAQTLLECIEDHWS